MSKKQSKAMTITVHCMDKNSSNTMSLTVRVDGKTKDELKMETDKMFEEVPFSRFYTEVEGWDDYPSETLKILNELDLSPQ